MALLVVVKTADGNTVELRVPRHEVSIGRDQSCHVVLPSTSVSRLHAHISFQDGKMVVKDSSSNGTFVGSELIQKATAIAPVGSVLRLGPFTILVSQEAGEEPSVEEGITNEVLFSGEPRKAVPQVTSPPVSNVGDDEVPLVIRKQTHRMLIDYLDLASLDEGQIQDTSMRKRVGDALDRIIQELGPSFPSSANLSSFKREMIDEVLGLGPLEQLLADPEVSEIMVVDPYRIYAEKNGKLQLTSLKFSDDNAARAVIERIVTPLGRRIDESTPLVDARLKDGSRVNAVIRPLAINGACITIRKFKKDGLGIDNLVKFGSLNDAMARFLSRSVASRKNIVISGGTGSGKTTLLNILSSFIPEKERVITIEDAAELQLMQPHVVSLETRPPNMEGRGEYTIRDLVKNALRMRPDRIVVGECRGGEALDMLQAMNTGHDGSMTTTHANSPTEAVARLETLALMSGLDLPARAVREQIAASVHLVVQQSRFSDGSRRIKAISEVAGLSHTGTIQLNDIFVYERTGTDSKGMIEGEFRATGYLPSYLDEFIASGLVSDGNYF